MPLEVVQGESRNPILARKLAEFLRSRLQSGTLYLGYPVLATADERVDIDALLVSPTHGLVVFTFADEIPQSAEQAARIIQDQDRLFGVLESYLGRHESLRRGRQLAVSPNTATLFSSAVDSVVELRDSEGFFGELEALQAWLDGLVSIDEDLEKALQAALQRVTTIKPAKKRAAVRSATSRGAKLKEIEKGIANLDKWQKAAAIESPQGPQRIRGLAGSGKTVVLALKAAYLHAQHPDWNIALTFHSRALYQQIDDLVTRFAFEHSFDRPDFDRLRIIHSWGSRGRPGIYSMIAAALGEVPLDWNAARAKYGIDLAFQGACQELLIAASNRQIHPIFDAVLIDEAQDLPPEFFRLVYLFTTEPKRIVWGYDELQKLSESAMPSTDELFGVDAEGIPLISLHSSEHEPRRDIVLPVCYRNTPWALSTAHAIGVGAYRTDGLVQHPDEPRLWSDIGYSVHKGILSAGSIVELERAQSSYPEYFKRLLAPDDAVVVRAFTDEAAQDQWVAAEVARNLTEDELEADDILIVVPDSYRAKSRAPRLMHELRQCGIQCHLVGVNTSQDEVFVAGSVAIAHIYRAKGNEAPMVYAVDAQHAATTTNPVTARNTLFTAITRSRAWVRITGYGDAMTVLDQEIGKVLANEFRLRFTVPTTEQLASMRHIYRERTAADRDAIKRATEGLETFLESLERGDIDVLDLSPAVRTKLVALRRANDDEQS